MEKTHTGKQKGASDLWHSSRELSRVQSRDTRCLKIRAVTLALKFWASRSNSVRAIIKSLVLNDLNYKDVDLKASGFLNGQHYWNFLIPISDFYLGKTINTALVTKL